MVGKTYEFKGGEGKTEYVRRLHILIECMRTQINKIIQVCVSMLASFNAVRRKTSGTSRIFHSMFHSDERNKILGCCYRWWYVVKIRNAHVRILTYYHTRTDKDRPNMPTLRVFLARENQAITYNPGVWHHPMIALDRVTDFVCLVWEDGTAKDCDVVVLDKSEHKIISPSASL